MFVLRSAFWLTLVILLLPADPETGEAPRSVIVNAVMSAQSSVAGLSGFCTRNPDLCMTGGAAIDLVAEKAEDGVNLIYDLIDGERPEAFGAESRRGTLTTDDLALPWRGGSPDDKV